MNKNRSTPANQAPETLVRVSRQQPLSPALHHLAGTRWQTVAVGAEVAVGANTTNFGAAEGGGIRLDTGFVLKWDFGK